MTPTSFYFAFKRLFPPEQVQILVKSLRQDPLVWQYVNKNLEILTGNVHYSHFENWTPSNLGLHALGFAPDQKADAIGKANKLVDGFEKPVQQIQSLDHASALALFLGQNTEAPIEKDAFCDSGMFFGDLARKESQKHVAALLEFSLIEQFNLPEDIFLHNVLCQPFDEREQVKRILLWAAQKDAEIQLRILQELARLGRIEIQQMVADQLLASSTLKKTEDGDTLTACRQTSLLLQAAGKDEEANQVIDGYLDRLQKIKQELDMQKEGISRKSLDAVELFADESLSQNLAQLDQLLSEQNNEEAKPLAQEIVSQLISNSETQSENEFQYRLPIQPRIFIEKLNELGLKQEALQASLHYLSQRPNDEQLISAVEDLFMEQGQIDDAIHFSELGLGINPNSLGKQRNLAKLYAKSDQHESALELWSDLTRKDEQTLNLDDWIEYARAAFKTDKQDEVIRASAKILEEDSSYAPAYHMLGKTYLRKGDLEQAKHHLHQSTMLNAEDQEAWLDLSKTYEMQGNEQAALDTLRSGAMANPTSSELNYALASELLNAGTPTEALPYLKLCVDLSPSSSHTAHKLGTTLFHLGSLTDSEKILGAAFDKWPTDPEISASYAETLFALGKKEEAIEPLEVLLENGQTTPLILSRYANSVLAADHPIYLQKTLISAERLEKGVEAVSKLLQHDPQNKEGQLWMAESLLSKGQAALAKTMFMDLFENDHSGKEHFQIRLKSGLGVACLELGETEAAITALQEVTQYENRNHYLLQKLAEAYAQANLAHEASQTADYLLSLTPDNLAQLEWYAAFNEALGLFDKAVEARMTAYNIDPSITESALATARLYIQLGEKDLARNWLETALSAERITSDEHRQAGYSYLRLQDEQNGMSQLAKALENEQNPSAVNYLETAVLSQSVNGNQAALSILQEGLTSHPGSVFLLAYQADLLLALKANHEAMQAISKAFEALNDGTQNQLPDDLPGFVSRDWLESLVSASGLNSRIAALYLENGQTSEGLKALVKLVEHNPDQLVFRARAIEAALGMMDFAQIQQLTLAITPDSSNTSAKDFPALVDYHAALAETALFLRKIGDAEQHLTIVKQIDPAHPHGLALAARIHIRRNDRKAAEEQYKLMSGKLGAAQKSISAMADWQEGLTTLQPTDWVAETALEIGDHDRAMQEAEKSVENQPGSIFNQLRVIRIIADAAYSNRLRKEMMVKNHAVQGLWLLTAGDRVDSAEQIIEQTRSSSIAKEWAAIARTVLEQNPDTIHELIKYSPNQQTAKYFVACYRWMENYSNALEICDAYPEEPELLLHKTLMNMTIDAEEAVKSIAKAIHIDPDQPLNYVAAALIAENHEDYEGALTEIDTAMGYWGDEPEWLSKAAQLSDRLGDVDSSVSYYKKAAISNPNEPKYNLAFAYALLDAGKAEKAVTFLEDSAGKYPVSAEMNVALGSAYLKAGEPEKAAEKLQELIESQFESSSMYILQSQIAFHDGNDLEALQAAQKAVEIDSGNHEAIYYQIQLLRSLGRSVEALSLMEQYLRGQNNPLPEFSVLYAELVYEVDGAVTALQAADQLQMINNRSFAVNKLAAKIYYEAMEYDKFSDVALQGLRQEPEDPELNFWLGKVQTSKGQLDQAVQCFSTVIQNNPENREAYLDLANIYQQRREEDLALQVLEKSISAYPEDYKAYYQAGLMLRDAKNFEQAESMLRQAAALAPDDVLIRRQLGAIIALNLVHQV